jgi:transposase
MMPCADGLSDAQAADAGRARMDWKDALARDVTDPGCAAAVLSECRQRLITGHAARLLFETRRTRFREQGLLNAKGRQRPDSTHGRAAIQTLNRLACIGDTRRQALKVLATVAPAWLQSWVPAVWCDRSRQRLADDRLPPAKPARDTLAMPMGMDGRQRRWARDDPATPAWLRAVPAMQTRRPVWLPQFYASPADQPRRGRHADDLPPAPRLISSPDDPDARDGKQRATDWTGDKVPVTDTCDDEAPNLMTDVLPTPATTADVAVLPTLQDHLATRQVTPRAQGVEAGYGRADHLLTSRTEPGIDLLGPVPGDQRGQGQAQHGVAAANVVIAWEAKQALCPPGQRRVVGMERPDRHRHATVRIAFRKPVCAACASRAAGTRAASAPRALRIRAPDHDPVLQDGRARQQTETFKPVYARRAGIEGTMAQGTRLGDLRRARSSGLVKTRLMPRRIAAALHCMRVAAWRAAIPRAQTRPSAVAALAAA